MPKHRRAKPKPKRGVGVFLQDDGAVLIETYRESGGIEELAVAEAPNKPSAHNDDDCPDNCECRSPSNE